MAAPNKHGLSQNIQQGPTNAYAVTPSDSADLPARTRTLYVGTAGNLAVLMADDTATDTNIVVFKNFAAGQIQHIAVRRVLATNTTATDIVAGW